MPKITVLIPTFNRAEYLPECLDSILSQTIPATQIIVVDDGSSDNTKEILKPYKDTIEYLYTCQEGKPNAINHGLTRISGDYLWIFDDDDVALPDALERFVSPLEKYSEYGFSFSAFFYTSTLPKNNKIGSILGKSDIPDLETRGFLIPLLESNFLGGAALFARTYCYHKVGQFNPKLIRSQDYEMAVRIARNFKGIQVSGGPTFHYRQHQGTRGTSKYKFPASERHNKWLEFDQIFFRNQYKEINLAEYLPQRKSIDNHYRQAILQRISTMASKFLLEEVICDLKELAHLKNNAPLSKEEKNIIKKILKRKSYYFNNNNDIFDVAAFCMPFIEEIRALAVSSKIIRLLRKEIVNNIISLCNLNPKKIKKYAYCILMLYLKSK